jgi:deoxyadenosine/deoxycytidine kinase
MKVITIAGMIGVGKSSLADLLGEVYGGIVKQEKLDSPLLELFYTETEEERQAKRIPFLLQLDFLNSRYAMIKECMRDERQGFAVLDRSIFEDWYFAYVNYLRGAISKDEINIYEGLLLNMLEEIDELPQKAPHLTIYIRTSYETSQKRIAKRDRSFETESNNEETTGDDYFRQLHEGYDDFMYNRYKHSEVLTIDGEKFDFVENPQHKAEVLQIIDNKLRELGVIA